MHHQTLGSNILVRPHRGAHAPAGWAMPMGEDGGKLGLEFVLLRN